MTGPPRTAATTAAAGGPLPGLGGLAEARLELDRVVDAEADHHRQHRHRGHRQGPADQGEEAEGEAGRPERDEQRQQPERRPEDQDQDQRHDHEGDREEEDDLAADLVGEALDHDRDPADLVARVVGEGERVVGDRLADQRDRLAPGRVGDVRLQPDRDQRALAGREEVAELRLRDVRPLREVEDDRLDELRVLDRDAVEHRDRAHVELRELGVDRGDHLALRLLDECAVSASERPDCCACSIAAALVSARSCLSTAELLADRLRGPRGRLVEEGRRPEHDPRRAEVGDLLADGRDVLAVGVGVAGEAALEHQQPPEVLGQDELLEVPLGEDDDRVIPEALPEVLGPLEGGRPVVDELVGAGIGRQPQRPEHGDDRDDRNDPGNGGRRPSNGPLPNPPKQVLHRVESRRSSINSGNFRVKPPPPPLPKKTGPDFPRVAGAAGVCLRGVRGSGEKLPREATNSPAGGAPLRHAPAAPRRGSVHRQADLRPQR